MNIVVIVEDTMVEVYKKWSDVQKAHTLKKDDFVKHGNDYIVHFDKESYSVSRDIKLLEAVASERVFGKPKIDWLTAIMTAIVTLICVAIVV
jgi:hypothetical protein